jgi:peptidylprolyl isomerase
MKISIAILIILVIGAGAWLLSQGNKNSDTMNVSNNTVQGALTRATFHTNKGDIVLELETDKTPITVGNFVKLAREGFYDGTKFHRVIENFMIQGGDPNTKQEDTSLYGQGGPGYTIEDEFVDGLSNVRGTISMANTGQPRSGGSQFFINLVDNTGLDFDKQPYTSKHPVFGHVIEGMDIVDIIAQIETDARDMPLEPVIIQSISVMEE